MEETTLVLDLFKHKSTSRGKANSMCHKDRNYKYNINIKSPMNIFISQIGNAVPPPLGRALGQSIGQAIVKGAAMKKEKATE